MAMMRKIMSLGFRTYSELITLATFEERFEYLRLDGEVAEETFGYDRYLNQLFYHSDEWRKFRNHIILRDNDGSDVLDMALDGFPIKGRVIIHHMNPITVESINDLAKIMNPEEVVCVSHMTHNAIHYGDFSLVGTKKIIDRLPNDTCPWKGGIY